MWNSVTGLEYQNLDEEIKKTMKRSAGDVVRLGYLLRSMMDKKLWEEYYDCFDDYLRNELHMDYTMASRFIGINKKYSVDGGSENIDTKWEGYSQAVLIEMLSMPPELEEKVTPEMTVRQVREVKRQARKGVPQAGQEGYQTKQETSKTEQRNGVPGTEIDASQEADEFSNQASAEEWFASMPEGVSGGGKDEVLDAEYRELDTAEEVATSQPDKSAYGLAKTEYPEGSLLTTEGCGNKYNCFSCAQDCGIRQKERYCTFAPFGNPFNCTTMGILESLKSGAGDGCQFVNHDLAPHMAGSGEADPCCCDCGESCQYRCEKPCQGTVTGEAETREENGFQNDAGSWAEENPESFDELAEIKHILAKEQKTLDEYLADGGLPVKLIFKQKTIVAALASMICDLEAVQFEPEPQEDAVVQPELPVFKNNNQRKEWLRSYRDWGLWYRDGNIGVEYYKYDFDNGGRLIAEVYTNEATEFHDAYEYCRLHLVGGPKPPKGKCGIGKWAWHEKYSSHPNSETELVEFLKEVQQKQES